MTQICVYTNADSMERSRSGQITGKLALQLGSTFYPDQDWNDFVVIVLQWWLQQVSELAKGSNWLVLRFMDGPYAVELSRREKRSFNVDLRYNDERIRLDADIDDSAFAQAVLIAANEVLQVCRTREWKSDDIDALKEAFDSVQGLYRGRSLLSAS